MYVADDRCAASRDEKRVRGVLYRPVMALGEERLQAEH